jgi:hypothetical protein
LDEAGTEHGMGSPLRCQRVNVKFTRQNAAWVAGPGRIIFAFSFLSVLLKIFFDVRFLFALYFSFRPETSNPQRNHESAKNNLGFVFQINCLLSTTVVRVLSLSRWCKNSPENYRHNLIGDY